jgi:alkylation response protein AidB-like acyl-CoA dehydrogenase
MPSSADLPADPQPFCESVTGLIDSQLPEDSVVRAANFKSLLKQLGEHAVGLDNADAWPADKLAQLSDAGVLGWLVPTEFGGRDASMLDLVAGYERLAASCLTTTFVLTQRNAAIQRIVRSRNEDLKAELLPELVGNSLFATVGISHLTTSRQHWKEPTVAVEQVDTGFILRGVIPWVTGADQADIIVSGGQLPDGKQVLLAIETCCVGVSVEEAAPLMALNASRTSSVRLDGVFVEWSNVLHGPIEQVMQQGGGGAGTHTTSALAIGHAANAIELLRREAERRPELNEILEAFTTEHAALLTDLYAAAKADGADLPECQSTESMRRRSNSLALRAAQAALAATKGAGFVTGHPASRLVSEAMFFLVWSCPQPVVLANLRELASAPQ